MYNKQYMKNKKVIIIGAGISGLVAGVYALKEGYDALIIEKNSYAGGLCVAYDKDGYKTDLTIHWLTGTGETTTAYDVWKDVHAFKDNQEFIRLPSLVNYEFEGKTYSLLRDLEKNEKEWIELSPSDEKQIHQFFSMVKKFGKKYERKETKWQKIFTYLKLFPLIYRTGRVSREEYVRRFKSPGIKGAILNSQYGYNSLFGLVYEYALFYNGNCDIPVGGSDTFASNILEYFKSFGGNIVFNEEVTSLRLENGKISEVITPSSIYKSDYVISTVPLKHLYDNLLPNTVNRKAFDKSFDNHINKKAYIPSMFGVTITFENDISDLPTPYVFSVNAFKIGAHEVNTLALRSYAYEPSRYIKNGKTVANVLVDQNDYDYFEWKKLDLNEVEKEKQRISAIIVNELEKKFPKCKNKIKVIDCFTPLTLEKYCNATHGGYMSFSKVKDCLLYSHPKNIKGISNLVLGGQWVSSPGGIPMAALSGKNAVKYLKKIDSK